MRIRVLVMVHEVALVDPGTQSAQVQDGPTVSRVEDGEPDRGPDANRRIQKLLATVKKPCRTVR